MYRLKRMLHNKLLMTQNVLKKVPKKLVNQIMRCVPNVCVCGRGRYSCGRGRYSFYFNVWIVPARDLTPFLPTLI